MYCPNCGEKLEENDSICPRCGCSINRTQGSIITPGKETNVFAIVGFIFSFFIGTVGLIFGIIGLVRSKKTKSGEGLSIAAVTISFIRIIVITLLYVYILYLE